LVLFASDNYGMFAVLQSFAHTKWLNSYASSMRTDIRYTPSDCFETFPFPAKVSALQNVGARYNNERQRIMELRKQGVTKVSSAVFNRQDMSEEIQALRQQIIELDHAVATLYGWTFALDHDFYETKTGMRFHDQSSCANRHSRLAARYESREV
jgi:hypothetical protein